ncbi:MAG: altronate dehydratase, partial [Hyphomicrobiales bacterium]
MANTVRLDLADNVVTALRSLEAGVPVETEATPALNGATIGAAEHVTTRIMIPRGHKVATRFIPAGEAIVKYAQIIGYASRDIEPGEHVHVQNTEFRNTEHAYEFSTDLRHVTMVPEGLRDTFMGYRRANGTVGTRNTIAILTSVNCSATAARKIAAAFGPEELAAYPNVDGVTAFVHGTGCGMAGDGEGFDALQRVKWGYARHPNVAGVLMVGLGCEVNQIDWLLEANGIEKGPMFHAMNIQDVAGLRQTVEVGIAKVRAMLPLANEVKRTPCPVSEIMVGLQCGGSDAWSGITANPALGYACDLLVAQGGTGVLSETPEIYGAEHLLTRRAIDHKTGSKLTKLITWWEDYT